MRDDLRLEIIKFANLTRWRWVLKDSGGGFLADHEVRLDASSWQFGAFANLPQYVWWHAAPDQHYEPDRYFADEAKIVAEVGAWIGTEVFGPFITDALAKAAARKPITVRVVVPTEAEELLYRPLELAHIDGKPCAQRDVTLVVQHEVNGADYLAPLGERLRVLGLFSLPEGGHPLNLRHERQSLVDLIHRISEGGKAAEVQVLQYGVTRNRLRDVLDDGQGWDIIHISGHGAPGELILETAAGQPDRISATELAELLEPAREHVKLVTVSACWSAGMTSAQQRRVLGLPLPKSQVGERSSEESTRQGVLATTLAERLGCAVLAMRFPVDDDFAIALSKDLYRLLVDKGQPLPRALGKTLKQLDRDDYSALSVAAPAIFGESASGLTLAAPPRKRSQDNYDTRDLKMPGFPPQRAHFVGRTRVMAFASAVLAYESGAPGVLLHGMPGAGKTACAIELAYGHQHTFNYLVWYKAPDEGKAVEGALTKFALTLERYLPGFEMAHALADDAKLTSFTPEVTELVEQKRALIVIDNAESLLDESGEWRDPRWKQVIDALTEHSGLGRLVVTSRRVPAVTSGLQVHSVDALSPDEALLLVRELPHLRDLINGKVPCISREDSRNLALGILDVAQGHPKLLELANDQAQHPERLMDLVQVGGQVWRDTGRLPDGFFRNDGTTATAEDYLHILAAWTSSIADTLSFAERDLFWCLCCLEEPDRARPVLRPVWPRLWHSVGRSGQPPNPDEVLAAVTRSGLASVQSPSSGGPDAYVVHPGIAAAGRAQAGRNFQNAVDGAAARIWTSTFNHASGNRENEGVNTQLMIRAGLSASSYLIRLEKWKEAAAALQLAFNHDHSRENAALVLSATQQIADHEPMARTVGTMAQRILDPTAAETQIHAELNSAVQRKDYTEAAIIAEILIRIYRNDGRMADALDTSEKMIEYTRKANIGPMADLAAQAERLQVLNEMGRAEEVLAEVKRLSRALPPHDKNRQENDLPQWTIREKLLDTGRVAAGQLGHWETALELNESLATAMRERRASTAEAARTRYNDYLPLLRLGRTDEALNLLLECRRIFQDAYDVEMLGATLSALADAEDERDHGDAAVQMQRDALRFNYLAGNASDIALSYHNLGGYLLRHAREPQSALASNLAAALICALTGISGDYDPIVQAAAALLILDDEAPSAVSLDYLYDQIGDISGTDLKSLLTRLSRKQSDAEKKLEEMSSRAYSCANEIIERIDDAGTEFTEVSAEEFRGLVIHVIPGIGSSQTIRNLIEKATKIVDAKRAANTTDGGG